MILKTLSLINFRKFKNATIKLPDGVTGVIGLNGAGKSTIFEAVAWVLYGSVAARTSSDEIKRNGALHSDPCRVELDFIFEEDTYRIVREMSGKSLTASATTTVNGKVAATGAEVVSKYIQKKLGMDFKSFYTSIFAKQKELNTLSSMNASERRPLILRMLGIDSLDDIIKEIKSDKKNKDNLIEKLQDDLADEKGRDKIQIFKYEIKNFEKKKQGNKNVLKKSKEKIFVFEKETKNLEKNYNASKKEYEKIREKSEKLSEKKILFEQKNKIQEEIKILKNKISERTKAIEKHSKKTKGFENLEKDIKTAENRLNKLDTEIEKNVKKIEQKKTITDRLKKDISEVDIKKNKIKKMGPDAKCPTCDRILGDQHNRLLKTFDKDKEKKEKEIEQFLKEIKKEEEIKERSSREQHALTKKRNYLHVQLREKEGIDATIRSVSSEIKREKTEIENREKQLKKIGVISFNEKEFDKIKKQIDMIYRKSQNNLEVLNDKKDNLNNLKLDLEKKEGENKLVILDIKNLKEKITILEKFKEQIKDEKKAVFFLGMLTEVMSSFRTYLISRIRPTLSSYSSDFFERLTDSKYHEIELDENYDLQIYDNGELYNIERFSGGEEDLANLCLRLAISEVITERAGGAFNFIILDEIFGSQDNIRRQNIMKALNGLSSKFHQIFLITHVDDVKNDMENILFVTENENGISNVKIE